MNDKDFDLDIDFETIDELDDLPPFKLKPTATTHICETKVVKGKTFTWSCWLGRGEKCPICGKMELDLEGNEVL
jgi:hypothetical protein